MLKHDMEQLGIPSYREHVFRAAERMDGELIYNGSVVHAQVIVEALLLTARKTVKILSDGLNQGVYGHPFTIYAAKRFLAGSEDRKIQVVHERPELDGGQQNLFANEFAGHPRVTIRQLASHVTPHVRFHMSIADGTSYRFEEDKLGRAAIASFGGDNKTAAHLESLFDTLWVWTSENQAVAVA